MKIDEGLFGAVVSEFVILGDKREGHVVNYIPFKFGRYGIIGWVCEEGSEKWEKVRFKKQKFTFPDGTPGKRYIIKYFTAIVAKKRTINGHDFLAARNAIDIQENVMFSVEG